MIRNRNKSSEIVTERKTIDEIYQVCRSLIDSEVWDGLFTENGSDQKPEAVPDLIEQGAAKAGAPGFLPSLARLEWTISQLKITADEIPKDVTRISLNPSIMMLQLPWKNLSPLVHAKGNTSALSPELGEELVLAWLDPTTGDPRFRAASDEDLMVLKMAAEEIGVQEVANIGKVLPAAVENAVARAVGNGLLLAPPSIIRRDPAIFRSRENIDESFLSSPTFILQWHVTQACDLHCKHCYDRSDRSPLKPDQAIRILDDFQGFCRDRHVRGSICFTGGNPLLYPHLTRIYRAASDRGFLISILGNPSPRERIEELLTIQPLEHFQISLEGLPEHNDDIRGAGHFRRSIEFLAVLRDLGVYSMVMLTLTKENIDQVIPLTEMLRGQTECFNFNRLSQVGEGEGLDLPSRDHYVAFLERYLDAAAGNPIIRLKDNLFNIIRQGRGLGLSGGCTGFGCGAAFNFITLLADGEVHACRKFPSLIGNVHEQGIAEIYDSQMARRYRAGSSACRTCPIRPACGGCMAVTYGQGLDVFKDRDPFCFIDQ